MIEKSNPTLRPTKCSGPCVCGGKPRWPLHVRCQHGHYKIAAVGTHAAEVGRGGALLEADADPEHHVRDSQILLHDVKHVVLRDHVAWRGAGATVIPMLTS